MNKQLYARKNTNSLSTKPIQHDIETSDIMEARVWFNSDCNPVYNLITKQGDNYLTMSYGAMNDINHIFRTEVKRKKDLF